MDLVLNNLQWLICHKTKPNSGYLPWLGVLWSCDIFTANQRILKYIVINIFKTYPTEPGHVPGIIVKIAMHGAICHLQPTTVNTVLLIP